MDFIHNKYRQYWKHYRPLRDASEQARYLAHSGFTMTAEQIHEQLYKKHYAALRALAIKKLGGEELEIEIAARHT